MHALVSFPDHHHHGWEWGSPLPVLQLMHASACTQYTTTQCTLHCADQVTMSSIFPMDTHSSECSTETVTGVWWVVTIHCGSGCGLLCCSTQTRLTYYSCSIKHICTGSGCGLLCISAQEESMHLMTWCAQFLLTFLQQEVHFTWNYSFFQVTAGLTMWSGDHTDEITYLLSIVMCFCEALSL